MSKAPAAHETHSASEAGGVSRRAVVKIAAAAAVGTAVWAEPTIKGLARRPAYASAGSAAVIETIDVMVVLDGTTITIIDEMFEIGGVAFAFDDMTTNGSGSLIFIGPSDPNSQVSIVSVTDHPTDIIRTIGDPGMPGVIDGRITFRSIGQKPPGTYIISVTLQCD